MTIILTEHYRRLADVSQSVICFSVARAPACIHILHRSCVQSRSSSKPGWLLLRAAFRSKHQRRASELHGRSFPSAIKYDKAQKSYKIRIMGVILGALLFGAQAKALSHTLPLCIKQTKGLRHHKLSNSETRSDAVKGDLTWLSNYIAAHNERIIIIK